MNRALFVPAVWMSGMLSACWIQMYEDPHPTNPPTTPTAQTVSPPHINEIEIADWPPIGPSGSISVTATDDRGLQKLHAEFLNKVDKKLTGTEQTATLLGTELGEGLGTLHLQVYDINGAWAERAVEKLLVDLTPPKIQVSDMVLAKNGDVTELELYVGDAWVLGWVELSFQGTVLRHEFPHLFPATLGVSWDWSRVTFPIASLEAGSSKAQLVASDAAGNKTMVSFELTIDGTAPATTISQPSNGETVSGAFAVKVAATDMEPGQLWIEVTAGGGSPTTLQGPSAEVFLQSEDFASGLLDIVAVAYDEAGNRGAPVSVQVTIP
jgi:hypothetical protein